MHDPLLQQLVDKLSEFENRARTRFGGLGNDALTWQPAAGRWSVGQCLEHLIEVNELYVPIIHAIANGEMHTRMRERIPMLPGIWGKLLLNGVKPENAKPMRTQRNVNPRAADVPTDIIEKFCAHQRALAKAISGLEDIDLDERIITSPLVSFVTYSLRDALMIILAHEERHLNQADRVLEASQM